MTSGSDFLSRLSGHLQSSRTLDQVSPSSSWTTDYISSHSLSPKYLQPVLDSEGHTLVVSCAGSGKTTALSLKVLSDLSDSYDTLPVAPPVLSAKLTDFDFTPPAISLPTSHIWVGTFLRSGTESLRSRFDQLLSDPSVPYIPMSNVNISTVHAEFYAVVSYLTGSSPTIIEDSEDSKLLSDAFKSIHHKNPPKGLFSLANKYVNSLHAEDQVSQSLRLKEVVEVWSKYRRINGVWNHNDIQDYLISRLSDPEVSSYLSSRYDRIYIDEFQDISLAQYIILRTYLQGTTTCVVVGDDDQTIYSWRGSDESIISKRFAVDYQPNIVHLPVNYRCPSEILDRVVPSINHNTFRIEKDIQAFKKGGELQVYLDDISSLTDILANNLSQDLDAHRSIAILSRTNRDCILPALVASSLSRGTFKTSSGIKSSKLVSASLGVFDLLKEDPNPQNVTSFLEQFYQIPRSEGSILLGCLPSAAPTVLDLLLSSSEDDIDNFTSGKRNFFKFCTLLKDSYTPYDKRTPSSSPKGASTPTPPPVPISALETAFRYTASHRGSLNKEVSIATVSYLLRHLSSKPGGYSLAVQNLWNKVLRTSDIENPDITISTVHSFKGEEADSVYIWNDSKGIFPYSSRQVGITDALLEEERRIHYIACTRSREKLTILASKDNPGYFLSEMKVEPVQPPSTNISEGSFSGSLPNFFPQS